MRLLAIAVTAALLLTAAPLFAPAATAGPGCDPTVPGTCVQRLPCVFSFYNEPGCLVRNPCDPRYCDPWLP